MAPFPTMTFPLYLGRKETIHALDAAFQHHREVVLVTQKDPSVERPGRGDVYDVGVLARITDRAPQPDGTMTITVYAHRRVAIRQFAAEAGAFTAQVADLDEGPIPDAPELIRATIDRFEVYLTARGEAGSEHARSLRDLRDPGRVADLIAPQLTAPVAAKQSLLATLDGAERLERVAELMAVA
jgi:ATP-dependent Lon protease